jgi:histidinol-phosphate aminotransferase
MAGIRLGYAVGRKETLDRMAPHLIPNNVNQLVGVAAVASLKLPPHHLARERERNAQARRFAMEFFLSRGYAVADSRANFIMVNIRRELQEFRDGCRNHGVLVGRPFPPLTTWARISIGTMEEMRTAAAVFTQALG